MASFLKRRARPSTQRPPSGAAWLLGADGQWTVIKSVGGEGPESAAPRPRGVTPELRNNDYGRALAYFASVWAQRCVNIRAEKTADLLNQGKVLDRKTGKPVKDHPLQRAFELAYREYDQDYFTHFMLNALLFGEVFTEKVKGDLLPLPLAVRALPSLMVEPFVLNGRIVSFDFMEEGGGPVQFRPTDIAYYHTYNPLDTMRGAAPLAAALAAVNVDMYIQEYSKNYYKNGARVGLIVSPKSDTAWADDQWEKIRTYFKEQARGVANAFRGHVLNRAMDVTTVPPQSLEDQRFLTEDQRERIASALGVPVGMVMFADAKYQLSPEQARSFLRDTVIPDVNRITRFVDANLRPFFDPQDQVRYTADLSAVQPLLEDQVQKTTLVRERFEAGGITFNEMRQAWGYLPEQGGDVYLIPTGRVAVPREQMGRLVDLLPASSAPALQLQTAGSLPGTTAVLPLQPPRAPLRLPAPAAPGKASYGVPDGTVLLELADVEELLIQQQVLQRVFPADARIRWSTRDQLHITLVYAPLVDEPEFADVFTTVASAFTGLEIDTLRVTTFPAQSGMPFPVIALVKLTEELRALQAAVYQKFIDYAIRPSEYSIPGQWTPHITLGYLDSFQDAVRPGAAEMAVQAHCRAVSLAFTRGSYETIDSQPAGAEGQVPREPALDELRAWRRATLAHGREKGLRFVCHHLSAEVQAVLRAELAACDGSKTALAMLFNNARARLERSDEAPTYASGKSIQSTRLGFEAAFSDMLRAVVDEQMDRRRFGTVLRALLRKFGAQAYRDGLIDGGLDDGVLDDDDQATLNQLLAEQSAYVTAIGDRLFREDGRFEAQDSAKPLLWWNKSVVPLYQAGRLSADKNGLYEFAGEDGAESCATCQRLKGQRHRLKDWARHNLIPPGEAPDFECGGWQCKHQLIKVTGQARGTF